jgi:hypothetical protein
VVVTKRKVVRARYNNVTRYWGSRNVHRMSRYLPIESSKSPMTPVPESNQQDGSWMDDDSATDLLEDQNLFLGQHSRSRRRNAENRTARDRNWAMIRSLIDESLHSGNPSQCANSDCIPRESEVLVITFAGKYHCTTAKRCLIASRANRVESQALQLCRLFGVSHHCSRTLPIRRVMVINVFGALKLISLSTPIPRSSFLAGYYRVISRRTDDGQYIQVCLGQCTETILHSKVA